MSFNTGSVVVTRAVNDLVEGNHALLTSIMDQFSRSDWGGLESDDIKVNQEALENGVGDLMGTYIVLGKKVWIRTEINGLTNSDNTTVILFPSDY